MPRLISIDVLRGLAIALMIFINASSLVPSYAWLMHSSWHGCTLADIVFPLFLFIVGFSIGLAFKKAKHPHVFRHIMFRAASIFAWGLALNLLMHSDFSHLRFLGVLQRIAICYAITAYLALKTTPRTQLIVCVCILLGYYLALLWIPVPSFGAYVLTPEANLAGFIDRLFLSGHSYPKLYDAEGLLTTIPAIASTLIGLVTYHLFQRVQEPMPRCKALLLIGLSFLLLGALWGLYLPINKTLWTSSYVLWTGGMALLLLMICYFFVDLKKIPHGWQVFSIMGQHALALYVLHIILIKLQLIIILHTISGDMNLKNYLMFKLMLIFPEHPAALIYASASTLFWMVMIILINFTLRKRATLN